MHHGAPLQGEGQAEAEPEAGDGTPDGGSEEVHANQEA